MAAEPNHFSDYGFDPQIDFFQGLDEASMRRNRRDNIKNSTAARSMDSTSSSFHFKLQKPISKDVKKKQKQHHSKWWRTAVLFFRKSWDFTGCRPSAAAAGVNNHALILIGSTSSSSSSPPVYFTDTLSGSTSRPPPPPSAEEEVEEIPYISLRELNMNKEAQKLWRNSTSAMPLYLVT